MQVLLLSSTPQHRQTITRVAAIRAAGGEVTVAGFRRQNFEDTKSATYDIAWLGFVRNGDIWGRALASPLHFFRVLRAARRMPACDTIWAGSLDMLVLGLLARVFIPGRQRIVYDVIDLKPKQFAAGPAGIFVRTLERLGATQVDSLILSSPWFYWRYYRTMAPGVQPLLLENKVSPPAPDRAPTPPAPPWRILWHGQLRCGTSLKLIRALAEALPDSVDVHVWGVALAHLAEDFRRADAELPNFTMHGPYSDSDMRHVFEGAHFIFAFDVDDGRNSEILLPYRLYHGAARAIPLLGIAGTAIGDITDGRGLGWTFATESAEPLVAFFRSLTMSQYEAKKAGITPEIQAAAVYSDDYAHLIADIITHAGVLRIPPEETSAVVLATGRPAPALQRA